MGKGSAQRHRVLFFRPRDRGERDASIERDEAPGPLHGEREQIDIGQMPRTEDPLVVKTRPVADGELAWPKLVIGGLRVGLKRLRHVLQAEPLLPAVGPAPT